MKRQRHTTPLLFALATSMICANLVSTVSANGVYEKYNTSGWSQPIISVLMQGLAHDGPPWKPGDHAGKGDALLADGQTDTGAAPDALAGQAGQAFDSSSMTGQPDSVTTEGSSKGQQGSSATGSSNGPQNPSATGSSNGLRDPSATGSSNGSQNPSVTGSSNGPRNPSATGSSDGPQGPSAVGSSGESQEAPGSDVPAESPGEPKQYAFTEVTREYFDDALFIGDSRVAGVQLYSGWDNLTYYAENGMTIYNMFQSKTAKEDGRTLTIEEALQERSFGKIYLEIGINEMGTGTVDSFMAAYEEAVNHLRELQPDAILYVCGIMYVKQSKSESDPIFNNPNIQARNDRIAELADGENIFYLDINEVVTDETGNLNPDYTWDEVHLLGKYDMMWLDYFCSHGIVKESP